MIPSTAPAAFRNSYPLDLGLYNDDQQDVLYITDDPAGHNLHLDISNASGQAILLSTTGLSGSTVASASNYHFALHFRPGTLSPVFQSYLAYAVAMLQGGTPTALDETLYIFATETKDALQAALHQQGWNVGYEQEASGTAALYFLSPQTQALAPGTKVSMIFPHASAAGASGARSTRVELQYQQVSLDNNTTIMSGSRRRHLTIVNQRGQKHMPLHVSFVGADAILNDGKAQNTLTLRITNVLKDGAIPLNSVVSTAPSKFVLSFDVQAAGETTDWALGTTSQVHAMQVTTTDAGHWSLTPPTGQEQSPEWILMPLPSKPALAADEAVTLTLSNIISSLPAGQTNLYISYENIPGYWDGQIVVPFEKSPLLYRGSNVGIGTATPHTSLDVRGDDLQICMTNAQDHNWGFVNWTDDKLYFQYREQGVYRNNAMSLDKDGHLTVGGSLTTNGITVNGNLGIGLANPQNQLAVAAQASFGGNARNTGSEPVEVQGPGAGVSFCDRHGGAVGRWVIYSDRTGGPGTETLRFWTDGDKVAITQAGNVGIGTDTPQNQLAVAAQASFGGNGKNVGGEPIEAQGPGAGVSYLDRSGGATGRWVIYSDRTGGPGTETLRFWSNGDKVAITQAGSLGIGTDTPHARLDVKGTDFQIGITNAQDHNWGLTNWTDDKLYFQYREQGVFKDNLMWLDKEGNLALKGHLLGVAKFFRIEHPTKPGAYLLHASLEGPESSVYYRGRAQLSDGRATIRLPEYFEALTRKEGRTVLLTPEGREPFLLSYEEIVDGEFRVYGTVLEGAFSWEIKAVRADVERLEPEMSKSQAGNW